MHEMEESCLEENNKDNLKNENNSFLLNLPKKQSFFSFSKKSACSLLQTKNFCKNKSQRIPRLVSKTGDCLIRPIHVTNEIYYIYRNWFHLLIEISWRSVLFIFASGFLCSWLFFGFLYYLIVQYFDYDTQVIRSGNHQCIANVQSFVSAFLFSLESQHTIGYGVRYMTEICPAAFIVLCVQLIVGVLLQTLLAGIVIAKVLRPKKRKQEIRFSEMAVIAWPMEEEDEEEQIKKYSTYSQQFRTNTNKNSEQFSFSSHLNLTKDSIISNNKKSVKDIYIQDTCTDSVSSNGENWPVLMIRLADVQHRLYLAESHVRLYMAVTKINSNSEKTLIGIKDMNVGYDNGTDRVLLLWPVLIRHIIDEDSPFYGMTPEKAENTDFELIMTVEGIVEATGMTFQARTSFLPNEIKWGQRFVPIVKMNYKKNNFEIDYSLFDVTRPCPLLPYLFSKNKHENNRKLANANVTQVFTPLNQLFTETIDEVSLNSNKAAYETLDNCKCALNCEKKSITSSSTAINKKISIKNDKKLLNDNFRHRHSVITAIDDNDDDIEQDYCKNEEDEYCRGGNANCDETEPIDSNRPLLVVHTHPYYSHHHGHHHFHQRHRNNSTSGFT